MGNEKNRIDDAELEKVAGGKKMGSGSNKLVNSTATLICTHCGKHIDVSYSEIYICPFCGQSLAVVKQGE